MTPIRCEKHRDGMWCTLPFGVCFRCDVRSIIAHIAYRFNRWTGRDHL